MIEISKKLYEVVEETYKAKRWRWKLADLDAPRGSGDLDDEWCDYLRDELGVIVEYCENSIQDFATILLGEGESFRDEVACKKANHHGQFLACPNPRNPDPEDYYSVLIFPKELADKIMVLGGLPPQKELAK